MSGRDLNWNDLRFFLAVARSRTLSKAGRRTGTDHATVGRRILALEELYITRRAALQTQSARL